jgi:hypothetical protein
MPGGALLRDQVQQSEFLSAPNTQERIAPDPNPNQQVDAIPRSRHQYRQLPGIPLRLDCNRHRRAEN